MNDIQTAILTNTGSQESSSFNELLRERGDDAPPEGCSWSVFLSTIRNLERLGYLEVDRNKNDKIDSLKLTESGAAEARALAR